jgi:hypothetical protein
MNTPEEIQSMADRKRESAIKNLETMFKIPDGYSSGTVSQIVRDIMDAVMLEITSIQAETLKTK